MIEEGTERIEAQEEDEEVHLPAEVTEFENGRLWVHQEVLRLNVSVTNTLGMDISKTAEQLVHVHLGREREDQHTASYP